MDEAKGKLVTKDAKGARTVGRVRWVIGLCLLVPGIFLTVRVLWLGAFYGSGFGVEDTIRFWTLLWAGVVLTLAGGWVGFRLRAAAWALIFFAVATLALLICTYGRWWTF
jgi:hypothetical protein